jgi:hypothetical protein
MIKTILCFVFLTLFFANSSGQNDNVFPDDRKKMDVFGPVKKIIETNNNVTSRSSKFKERLIFFDRFGFVYRVEIYYPDTAKTEIHQYIQDSASFTGSHEIFYKKKNEVQISACIYRNGHLISEYLNSKYESREWRYEYDDYGRKIGEVYIVGGVTIRRTVTIYNDSTLINEFLEYDKNDSIRVRTIHKWTDQTKMASVTETHSYGSHSTSSAKYDKYGNKIEQISIQLNNEEMDTTIRVYKYEYDSFNNWIRKEEFKDGKLESSLSRVFEYYQ